MFIELAIRIYLILMIFKKNYFIYHKKLVHKLNYQEESSLINKLRILIYLLIPSNNQNKIRVSVSNQMILQLEISYKMSN
jgi:hypothetical protein